MCRYRPLLLSGLFLLVLLASGPEAADEVQRRSSKVPLRGKIVEETSRQVVIRIGTGDSRTVAVPLNDVAEVHYDGPAGVALRTAEGLERAGQYQKARERYARAAKLAGGNQLAAAASQFGQQRALARMAEQDTELVQEAIEGLKLFEREHPSSRFHYELQELLGRLLMASGDVEGAGRAFSQLAKAPWPALQLRAATWQGRLLMHQGQLDQAMASFDKVAAASVAEGTMQGLVQQEARLLKAECLRRLKRFDEARKLLQDVIDALPPDANELQARAHNAMGDLLRDAGQPKDALLAYMYVDLMCSDQKEEHRKALYLAVTVSEQVGRSELATQLRRKLLSLYPDSSWANKLKQAEQSNQ